MDAPALNSLIDPSTINTIFSTIGVIAVAWLTYKAKIVETITARRDKNDDTRIKSSEAVDVENKMKEIEYDADASMRRHITWTDERYEKLEATVFRLQEEVDKLREARDKDAERIKKLTAREYLHEVYVSALIEHIEQHKGPPAPPRPVSLDNQ